VTIEPHLLLQELTLRPSGEWTPRHYEWFMVRVAEGVGYWLQAGVAARQLSAGDCLIATGNSDGVLRASQLDPLKLQFFSVQPQYLNGLLTVAEWHQLEVAPNSLSAHVSIFTAGEPLAQRFTRLAEQTRREGLSVRCGLLQLWANAIAELLPTPVFEPAGSGKLLERFRQLVGQMPEVELSQCSLRDLAGQLNCSERHFTRLFREEFGVPLRARQIELRLQRARQLLTNSDAKIINVAYDSGYQHLGLFNVMFKKRFGMTPSEWRQQNLRRSRPPQSRKNLPKCVARVGILLALFILNFISPAIAQTNLVVVPAQSSPTALAESNAAPHFNVRAYAVKSNTLLATNILTRIFSRYTGTNVSLDEIVKAASDLQLEYCNQGYPTMSIAIAQQQITNGTVTMSVFPMAFPQIWVSGSRYVSSGNQAQVNTNLSPAEPVLPQMAPATFAATTNAMPFATSNQTAADPETMARARAALFQKLAELDTKEKDTRVHVVSTNAGPRFAVEKYLVMGNSVLPPESIARAITNVDGAFGTNTSFDGIRAVMTELQMAYRERGYVTVSVGLPRQKLTNATVKVQVTEGRLAAINVAGNCYYSSNNVMRALPSLHTNLLLNSHVLQRELDVANASRDRQIYPVIGPGPEPDTSELTLKVKDQLPLHARLELNNQATPNTPDLRANLNLQYDNLWNLEHQIGLQYSCAFEQFKAGNEHYVVTPLDDPLIANYSGYYRLPLGDYNSVQDRMDANPGHFGYDEVTHKFNVPPATGRPELTLYATRSVSDTGVQRGPKNFLVDTLATNSSGVIYHPLSISTNSAGQNLTLNEGLGLKLSLPLPQMGSLSANLSFGADYKHFRQTSYNTNENSVDVQWYDQQGQLQTDDAPAPQPQSSVFTGVDYFPLNAGLNGSIADRLGTTFFNAAANFNVLPIYSEESHQITTTNIVGTNVVTSTSTQIIHGHSFSSVAYTTNAHPHYVTLQLGVDRVQTLYKDWSVKLHADGQWADGPLISNEQYGMGGTAGVRGYQDGQAYGDTGWRFSIEPQTRLFKIGMVGNEGHEEPCWVRASVFLDYGRIYLLAQPPPGSDGRKSFCGAGWAMTANIGSHVDGRLTVAWPLISHAGESDGVHIYFGVGAQF
jgi:hemolysin activation/secretion protein/AraC-like DNA-binding protein